MSDNNVRRFRQDKRYSLIDLDNKSDISSGYLCHLYCSCDESRFISSKYDNVVIKLYRKNYLSQIL